MSASRLPAEFGDILKDFTREILRSQPEDLYAFGHSYFSKLLLEQPPRSGNADSQVNNEAKRDRQQIEDELRARCFEFDPDRSGIIHVSMIRPLLVQTSSLASPTESELCFLLSRTYVRADGFVDYEECIPQYVDAAMESSRVRDLRPTGNVFNMDRSEFERILLEHASASESEALSKVEFSDWLNALRDSELNLRDSDVYAIASQAVFTTDGFVDFPSSVNQSFRIASLACQF